MPIQSIPQRGRRLWHDRRRLGQLEQRLLHACSYSEWRTAALEYDVLKGYDLWRADPASPFYPHTLLQEQITQLAWLREKRDSERLVAYMQESLHRTLGELTDPNLYSVAKAGTKFLVGEYLDNIETTLNYLCDEDFPGVSFGRKRVLFKHATRNFGCSALMLSGGGAFGLYHLGVIKTLLEHQVLPRVIAGTSMGAIVAGLVGTHTDEELLDILNNTESRRFDPIKLCSLDKMIQERHVLDTDQLLDAIQANIPAMTFLEAYQRTGRVINITVSPTRYGQKARILNYKTAPSVLIPHSCRASSSIPFLFPSVPLMAKTQHGDWVEYMDSERWADGGVHTDIPMGRMGRLHNVNHFIVSQTNPHVLPFIQSRSGRGMLPMVWDMTSGAIHAQWHQAIAVAKKRASGRGVRFWLDRADALLGQDYLGDINLHPNFPLTHYLKVMTNPSPQEVKNFILTGERATWPKLPMIKNQTRISRVLEACNARLRLQDRRQ